jgi:DNA polymerase elongation subunit (family B)
MTVSKNEPRILLFDLETAPAKVYTFGLFKTTIGMDQIIEPPRILCWSARWKGAPGKTVKFDSEHVSSTKDFLTGMRDLLDEADVVVGYNSDSFDVPWVNEQFMYNGIDLPSPYSKVDLYKVNKRAFYMPSRKLDYLALQMLNDRKVSHKGFTMWRDCMDPTSEGHEQAWRDMERYAKKDTYLLDPLFDMLRPFIRELNYGLFSLKEFSCTGCGSQRLQARGFRYTSAGKFQRYQCLDCFSWSTDPKRVSTTALRPLSA